MIEDRCAVHPAADLGTGVNLGIAAPAEASLAGAADSRMVKRAFGEQWVETRSQPPSEPDPVDAGPATESPGILDDQVVTESGVEVRLLEQPWQHDGFG